jgi:hypothetical protein
MSEWHWRSPVGTDTHLVVWAYVRHYAGGSLSIEIVVENGYMKVVSPADKSYTATVTINGSVRYGPTALSHYKRTRWAKRRTSYCANTRRTKGCRYVWSLLRQGRWNLAYGFVGGREQALLFVRLLDLL